MRLELLVRKIFFPHNYASDYGAVVSNESPGAAHVEDHVGGPTVGGQGKAVVTVGGGVAAVVCGGVVTSFSSKGPMKI